MINKTHNIYIISCLLTIIGLLSCDKAFFDTGTETSREIVITETFSSINFKNIFDVTIIQDTINKIIITCGENLQAKVSAVVKEGQLVLDHSETNNWSRKYKHIQAELHVITSPSIHVNAPINLKSIGTLKGELFWLCDYGKISEIDINIDVKSCGIYMSSDNFGVFKIKGKCENADLWGWGSAVVKADSLLAKNCHVKHRGFGDVYVNVSQQLAVSLEFSGNVYYTGNPSKIAIEEKLSSGSLILMK